MKVLWFNISEPSRYAGDDKVTLGWQDSLEVLLSNQDIELHIAFESTLYDEKRNVGNVTYHPITTNYSWWEKKKAQWDWSICENKVIKGALKVVEEVQPQIIHVWGNEWPYGLIAAYTNIPVVVHIQGSIIPYNNALYPPGYNIYNLILSGWNNPLYLWRLWKRTNKAKSRLRMEKKVWDVVKNYMGRTEWDRALVNILCPHANYFHVNEALRPAFINSEYQWRIKTRKKIKLFTTGMNSFWKGPDMLLKTAKILISLNIDFEWYVAGEMNNIIRKTVEKKEKSTFEQNNVHILGFLKPEELINQLCDTTIYVHCAYIENSPNSICEALYLGVPVISTNVGGISSLINNGDDGILLPSNDPWQMANSIIELSNNTERQIFLSNNGQVSAKERHKAENIISQLVKCYAQIITDKP